MSVFLPYFGFGDVLFSVEEVLSPNKTIIPAEERYSAGNPFVCLSW
jgi:hypothetical protein